jgi:hypothetical protein
MREQNRKAGLMALEKLKAIISESMREDINKAAIFVVEYFHGKTDEELINGYFNHKLKLAMEKLIRNIEIMLDDGVPHYRKATLELLMGLSKKVAFFQKEPIVMLIVNKIGDADKMITQMVQKFIAVVIKNYAGVGKVIIDAVNKTLQRPHLPEGTRFALVTCLANMNFEGSADQLSINACNEIFMKEFISNCTTKDESLSKIMNQCLRGLNKNLSNMKDVTLL